MNVHKNDKCSVWMIEVLMKNDFKSQKQSLDKIYRDFPPCHLSSSLRLNNMRVSVILSRNNVNDWHYLKRIILIDFDCKCYLNKLSVYLINSNLARP